MQQFSEDSMRRIARSVISSEKRLRGLRERRRRYTMQPYIGKKRLVRFTLNSALATTDASKAATITDQYGPGADGETTITVHNLLTSTPGTYVFEGDSGDAGLALWDSGTNYRIIQLECA